jgi:hypothetical protein
MKRCGACGKDKGEEQFGWKNKAKGHRQSYCKDCKNAANRAWYSRHAETQKQAVTRNNVRATEERRRVIRAAKQRPCVDCGHSYPFYVMDLDHVRGTKFRSISQMVNGHKYSIAKILEEIAKCDVVCANCHRERTFSRLGLTDKVLAS